NQDIVGPRRRRRRPEQVDQLVAGDRSSAIADEESEDEPALASRQLLCDVVPRKRHLKAPTQSDRCSIPTIHVSTVRLRKDAGKSATTGFAQAFRRARGAS